MALTPAICTQCGDNISVDSTKEAGVCPSCGTAFITEKVINNYTNQHIDQRTIVKNIYGAEKDEAEDYIKRAEVFLTIGDYAKAKAQYQAATDNFPANWLGWFGLIKAQTKNLKDFKDCVHHKYLLNALAVASSDDKLKIKELYKDFISDYEKGVSVLQEQITSALNINSKIESIKNSIKNGEAEIEESKRKKDALGMFKGKQKKEFEILIEENERKIETNQAKITELSAELNDELFEFGVCYHTCEGRMGAMNEAFDIPKVQIKEAMLQHGLAKFYAEEHEDAKKAVSWYKKAAEQGYAAAECELGRYYEHGSGGLAKDVAKAVGYYVSSAQKGDANGQRIMGNCCTNGFGVAKDPVKAFSYYLKAAQQGNTSAQASVGTAYHHGAGVGIDYYNAARWYKLAAQKGNAMAQLNLGVLYEKGLGGVGINKKMAVELYTQAANQGDKIAQYNLGVCYWNGRGIAVNQGLGVEWMRKAARQNDKDAQEWLRGKGQGW